MDFKLQRAIFMFVFFFFFQAEDGIRDLTVTGVQTCALPIFFMPPEPPQKPAQVDELEFIKSVTEDDTGAAPSARRASGAQFQPTIPSDPPRAAAPPSQRAANPVPAPIVPDPSAAGGEVIEPTPRCKPG